MSDPFAAIDPDWLTTSRTMGELDVGGRRFEIRQLDALVQPRLDCPLYSAYSALCFASGERPTIEGYHRAFPYVRGRAEPLENTGYLRLYDRPAARLQRAAEQYCGGATNDELSAMIATREALSPLRTDAYQLVQTNRLKELDDPTLAAVVDRLNRTLRDRALVVSLDLTAYSGLGHHVAIRVDPEAGVVYRADASPMQFTAYNELVKPEERVFVLACCGALTVDEVRRYQAGDVLRAKNQADIARLLVEVRFAKTLAESLAEFGEYAAARLEAWVRRDGAASSEWAARGALLLWRLRIALERSPVDPDEVQRIIWAAEAVWEGAYGPVTDRPGVAADPGKDLVRRIERELAGSMAPGQPGR